MQPKKVKRKVINLKDLEKVSPIVQAKPKASQESLPTGHKDKADKHKIPSYPPITLELKEPLIHEINSQHTNIRSLLLAQHITQRLEEELSVYYKNSDPIVGQTLKTMKQHITNSLKAIKFQRIEMMDANLVLYTSPDADKFQIHKNKYYSMLIREQLDCFKIKQTFNAPETAAREQYHAKVSKIEKRINKRAQRLSTERFEREFKSIIDEENQHVQRQLTERESAAKDAMERMLEESFRLKTQNQKAGTIKGLKVRLQRKNNTVRSFKEWGSLDIVLFRPEQIFT